MSKVFTSMVAWHMMEANKICLHVQDFLGSIWCFFDDCFNPMGCNSQECNKVCVCPHVHCKGDLAQGFLLHKLCINFISGEEDIPASHPQGALNDHQASHGCTHE